MLEKIINNQQVIKNIYYNELDKLRETFDFNNQDETFYQMQILANKIKDELIQHFALQEKLQKQINDKVDKLVLENMLVKDILIRMSNKIIEGAKNKDINIFAFFDDFEEILKAYLLKEKGLFIQELTMATNEKEREEIELILMK